MPILDDTTLFKRLKQGQLENLYLLFGQETYFVSSCVEKIIQQAVSSGFESFNLQRLNGEKLSMNDLEDAVSTLPMMAERKCVVVKDLDIDKLKKDEYEKLEELITNPVDTTVLVLYTTGLGYDIKKSAKLKKLSGFIEKNGVVCDFALKDKPTLKRALVDRAKKAGVELDMPVADILIDRCSQSYAVLQNEVDKLISYVSSREADYREITKADIDACCIASIDSTAFDLAKAILNRKYDRAFVLLDELFYQRMEALSILGALNMCFIDLYRAKSALNAGRSADQVLTDFAYPKNRSFAVKNAFRDVQGYSTQALHTCLDALMEADYQLKSSKLEDRLIMETMIGKMMV